MAALLTFLYALTVATYMTTTDTQLFDLLVGALLDTEAATKIVLAGG